MARVILYFKPCINRHGLKKQVFFGILFIFFAAPPGF